MTTIIQSRPTRGLFLPPPSHCNSSSPRKLAQEGQEILQGPQGEEMCWMPSLWTCRSTFRTSITFWGLKPQNMYNELFAYRVCLAFPQCTNLYVAQVVRALPAFLLVISPTLVLGFQIKITIGTRLLKKVHVERRICI